MTDDSLCPNGSADCLLPKGFMHLPLDSGYPSSQQQHDYVYPFPTLSGYVAPTVGTAAEPVRQSCSSSQTSPGLQALSGSIYGRGYTSAPAVQDARFDLGPATSMSPADSGCHSTPPTSKSAGSSHAYSSFAVPFNHGLSSSAPYNVTQNPLYPSSTDFSQPYNIMSEIRSRMQPSAAGMPPPSRSPVMPSPISPSMVGSAREGYASATPRLSQHSQSSRPPIDILSRSPRSPLSSAPRSLESGSSGVSPSSASTFRSSNGAVEMDAGSEHSLHSGVSGPPLQPTTVLHQMAAADGQIVHPEINARIDKGFFLADGNWTCYRRNYFSVACSYTLRPLLPVRMLTLYRPGLTQSIQGFAMSIAAVVDGGTGKPVELVQHTPKRDKGPQGKPDIIKLSPHTGTSAALFGDTARLHAHPQYDSTFSDQGSETQTFATFERIQFKSATANNGKRRAAQQFYHLVVELYADVGSIGGAESKWVKLAMRLSAPMVVRGRSPGHYQDDRRTSSSSAGPGGPGGSGYGGGPPNAGPGPTSGARGLGDTLSHYGGSGSVLGGGGAYQTASGMSSLHHSPASLNSNSMSSNSSVSNLDRPVEGLLSPDASSTHDAADFNYYAAATFDSSGGPLRPLALPSLSNMSDQPYGGGSDNVSQMSFSDWRGRRAAQESVRSEPDAARANGAYWQDGTAPSRYQSRSNVGIPSCGPLQGVRPSKAFYTDLPAL